MADWLYYPVFIWYAVVGAASLLFNMAEVWVIAVGLVAVIALFLFCLYRVIMVLRER